MFSYNSPAQSLYSFFFCNGSYSYLILAHGTTNHPQILFYLMFTLNEKTWKLSFMGFKMYISFFTVQLFEKKICVDNSILCIKKLKELFFTLQHFTVNKFLKIYIRNSRQYGCSPVNLLHIFGTSFPNNFS